MSVKDFARTFIPTPPGRVMGTASGTRREAGKCRASAQPPSNPLTLLPQGGTSIVAARPADVTVGAARDSMTVPGAACTAVGEAGIAARRLPWAAAQVGRWLDREVAAGRLADDRGRCPADVAARARSYLDAAVRLAAALDIALASAEADLGSLRCQASPVSRAVA